MAIIKEQIGDIFAAPPHSILIHACNARGSWGAGVALAFKKKYPTAFKTYNTHCLTPPPNTPLSKHQHSLVGTTLLISPGPKMPEEHWIACLFTSQAYGRNVSPPGDILENTKMALEDLAGQIGVLRGQQTGREGNNNAIDGVVLEEGDDAVSKKTKAKEDVPGECWAVRINSGMFGVPWGDTKDVLEAGGLDMTIVRPAGEEEDVSGGAEKDVAANKVSGEADAGKKKRKSEGSIGEEEDGSDRVLKKTRKRGLDRWLKG